MVTAAPNTARIKPKIRAHADDRPHARRRYNAIGVLVDAATSDYSPYALPSTPLEPPGCATAVLTGDQITGRNSCQNYNDPSRHGGPT